MKQIIGTLVISAFILISSFQSVMAQSGLTVGSKLPTFKSYTNNNRSFNSKRNLNKKVSVIVLSNYCSIELAGVWAIPIYYHFRKQKSFEFSFVFSRECIPVFIPNWFVTRSISNAVKSLKLPYMLLDLSNETTRTLKGGGKYAHIYVVDQKGVVRWKKTLKDPYDPISPLKTIVSKLLKGA